MINGVRVPHDQRAHESILPWQKGWQTLKAIWPQLVYISLVTVSIPQCLLAWTHARKAWVEGAQFDFNPLFSLTESMQILKDFVLSYLPYAILAFLLGFLGYLSVIAIVLQLKRGLPATIVPAFREALKALPRGTLLLAMAFGLLVFAMQLFLQIPGAAFFLQFIVVLTTVLMAGLPILLIVEPKSPLRVLRSTFRMSYVDNSGFSRWSAFFVLLSFELLLIGGYTLVDWLALRLKFLDVAWALPRELWTAHSDFFPFGIIPAMVDLLKNFLEGLLAMGFATFTASFVLELSYRSRLGERIEVMT